MLTAMVGLISILGTVRAEIKTLPLSVQLMALTKTVIIETTKRRSREMGNRFRWLTSASALRSLRRWQEILR
jgi:superfamily II RNA helicase